MCVYGEQSNARRINPSYNEICSDVSLISEEMLLEHGHAGNNSWFAAGGEGVQLEFRGDECGCEFGICGGACSGTPDLRGDVMKLLAVLKRSERQLKVGVWWLMGSVPYLPLSVHWLLWYLRQSMNDEISMILVMSKVEV